MKRLCMILVLSLLLPLLALAAPEARYPDSEPLNLPVELLESPQGYADGPWMVRMIAPNGQPLYFISQIPEPVAHSLDLNFDGVEDLAVLVASGASNMLHRLFIQQGDRYVPVIDSMEEGLFNFALYPTARLIASHATSGLAGALHEDVLLRWEGARLVPIRRAVSESLSELSFDDKSHTEKTWSELLRVRVYDHESGAPGEPRLLFDEQFDIAAEGNTDAYLAFFRREQQALWQGLAR